MSATTAAHIINNAQPLLSIRLRRALHSKPLVDVSFSGLRTGGEWFRLDLSWRTSNNAESHVESRLFERFLASAGHWRAHSLNSHLPRFAYKHTRDLEKSLSRLDKVRTGELKYHYVNPRFEGRPWLIDCNRKLMNECIKGIHPDVRGWSHSQKHNDTDPNLKCKLRFAFDRFARVDDQTPYFVDYTLAFRLAPDEHGEEISLKVGEHNTLLDENFETQAITLAKLLEDYRDAPKIVCELDHRAQCEALLKEAMGLNYTPPELRPQIFSTIRSTTKTAPAPKKILNKIEDGTRIEQDTGTLTPEKVKRNEILTMMIDGRLTSEVAGQKYGKTADAVRQMKSRALRNISISEDQIWEKAIEATFIKPTWYDTVEKQMDGFYALVKLDHQPARIYFLVEERGIAHNGKFSDDADDKIDAALREAAMRVKGSPRAILSAFRNASIRLLTFSGEPQDNANPLEPESSKSLISPCVTPSTYSMRFDIL